MTLVLLTVLVWYTTVVPPGPPAPRAADKGPAGPEEWDVTRLGGSHANASVRRASAARQAVATQTAAADDELDWPEIIGDE